MKGLRWQIEIDRVVTMVTRDFVWQEPVIQTHDFSHGDVEVPLMASTYLPEIAASPHPLRDSSDPLTHELSSRPEDV